MTKPATRVLAVLELLQAHGQQSGRELAERLAVDGRTLRRYIAALEEIGIPVIAERGRYGGYKLVAGFKLPPMMFTDEETLAISLGLAAARGLGLADAGPAVESAQAKLERVMPTALKPRLRALTERATLDLAPASPEGGAALVTLASAAHAQQRVRLAYQAEDGEATERDVDPYGLVYRRGRWYLCGHCHLRRDLRTFRLDRIRDARPLPASFLRPADFDAARYLQQSFADMQRAHPVDILLRTDLATALSELGSHVGALTQQHDGVRLQTSTDSLRWFARQLAALPFEFSVRAPDALNDELRECAARLLRAAA
ncbi:helix-turn-helix transcriptional regulator [Chitinolyticbacter meiyuanensis]|uniref:helix-turn-helix transcriptional regulator n=1 Tax=Chitinolyticbacter meiyuanensis TaxID=682798 RepID=UPI0011E59B0B|nr:YafY family protein [Chitinolyticbacter meiyuanensis]